MKATGKDEEVWPHNKNNEMNGRIRTVKYEGVLLWWV